MIKHECPGGCGHEVPRHQLACRIDWYRLPKALRDEVNTAWRAFNLGETDSAKRHRAAVAEAIAWYRAHPVYGAGAARGA